MALEPGRAWFWVAELLTQYSFASKETRHQVLTDPPDPTGDERFDALLGALAEHLCYHDGVPAPPWVNEPGRFLDQFWFPTNTPAARADSLVHAPASFVRRGVFIERRTLERA